MPLMYIKTSRQFTLAVWRTTEDLESLQSTLSLTPQVTSTLETCKPHRRMELIGTRHLLKCILAEAVTIIKDANGRPLIKEYPQLSLSVSHSGDYSAVMLSHEQRIGMDIQVHRETISRIAPKFLYPTEIAAADIKQLHYYWGIKESVFKAWSKGGVDFKSMITVSPLRNKGSAIETSVCFDNGDVQQDYIAQGKCLGNLYLTSVVPKED